MLAFAVFSIVTAFVLWSILGAASGGIRGSEGEELEGLDIGEHGMEAYPEFTPTLPGPSRPLHADFGT